jgi:hypothetical protein
MMRLRIALACVAGLSLASAAHADIGAKQYGAQPSIKEFSVSEFHRPYAFHNNAARGYSFVRNRTLQNLPAKQVGSVPEQSTWAMLLIGVGLIGLKLRSHQPRKFPTSFAGAM